MSKDDFEMLETLLNPYIEINKSFRSLRAYINVSTFGKCLGYLIPPFTDKGPTLQNSEEKTYCIYGVVGRTFVEDVDKAYLNVEEDPISKTLMGFLSEDILKKNCQ